MNEHFWGKVTLREGENHYLTIGDLHLWLTFKNEEVWIAHIYEGALTGPVTAEEPPNDIEWARWAHKVVTNEVQIEPVYPDLPLVVHSEYTLKVSPQTQIQIYTRIPVWLRISLADIDYKLVELPTVKRSRTWFGTPIEGELCYHAVTKARRTLSHVDHKQYLVSCPITITNRSKEELNFEYFCFRVERLSMYEHGNEFWADETQIIYQGEDLNSDVIMTGKLHDGIRKNQLLTPPRTKIQKSLATRTFKLFEDALTFGR